jgi:hypothetical protein
MVIELWWTDNMKIIDYLKETSEWIVVYYKWTIIFVSVTADLEYHNMCNVWKESRSMWT